MTVAEYINTKAKVSDILFEIGLPPVGIDATLNEYGKVMGFDLLRDMVIMFRDAEIGNFIQYITEELNEDEELDND